MKKIFNFLYKNNFFFIFLLLEFICFLLIINNDGYQSSKIINSANVVSANIYRISSNTKEYLLLKEENELLAAENNFLKSNMKLGYALIPLRNHKKIDTLYRQEYVFINAKVINSSVNKRNNYLTLNVGSKQGVSQDNAVIGNRGIVGVVKAVSGNYASVMSLLHKDVIVPCQLKKEGINGTLLWNGLDCRYCDLIDIPTHAKLKSGDTVVTSSLSSIFPEGILVGFVESHERKQNESFYTVKIKLSTDFKNPNHVSVVKFIHKSEKDSLEINSQSQSGK
ncbi:MAG: rod shape-determining protein MreC [Bacteroidota bacterium]